MTFFTSGRGLSTEVALAETVSPYDYINDVAAGLRHDGLEDAAEKLLGVHAGIFNGTELLMAWRWNIERLMEDDRISLETRESAERAWNYFSAVLAWECGFEYPSRSTDLYAAS